MSKSKSERLSLACSDIDAFATAHNLDPKDVLKLVGSVTGRLLGGGSREIDAERTTEGIRLVATGESGTSLFSYHAGMTALRDVALSAEALPSHYALLHLHPAEQPTNVVPLFQEQEITETTEVAEAVESLASGS